MKVFKLVAENLTNATGPMGSETFLPPYFEEYFESIDSAKKFAQNHYTKKEKEYPNDDTTIKWEKTKTVNGVGVSSWDMGWVMYDIYPIKIRK